MCLVPGTHSSSRYSRRSTQGGLPAYINILHAQRIMGKERDRCITRLGKLSTIDRSIDRSTDRSGELKGVIPFMFFHSKILENLRASDFSLSLTYVVDTYKWTLPSNQQHNHNHNQHHSHHDRPRQAQAAGKQTGAVHSTTGDHS